MLTGLFVPLITPMAPNGSLALPALEALAHQLLDDGVTGLVALGTTGEPATLDEAERRSVIEVCARVCRERGAPLIVGAGSSDTAASVRAVRELAAWPEIAAALVPVPAYTRPGEEGVIAHLTHVAAASPMPVVVYNIPYRTGQLFSSAAMLRLAASPNIAGVKHTVGAVDPDTCRLLAAAPPGFAVLGGDDAIAPALLALGAAGAIVASAHLSTKDFVSMTEAWRAGDAERGRTLGRALHPLCAALFAEPSPSVVKGVLHDQGLIPSAALRLPLLPASPAAVDAALACLS